MGCYEIGIGKALGRDDDGASAAVAGGQTGGAVGAPKLVVGVVAMFEYPLRFPAASVARTR